MHIEWSVTLIANLIGVVAIIVSFFLFLSTKRERILAVKFVTDILWAVNFFMLGGWTGGILNVIGMGREIVFINRDKKKWASSPWWLVFFILISLISPSVELLKLGEISVIPLLPAIGSVAAVILFYSRKPIVMKWMSLAVYILWAVYDLAVKNYAALISEIITLVSGIIGLSREYKLRKKAKAAAAAEAAREEAEAAHNEVIADRAAPAPEEAPAE